jgi:hypothetical protein
MLAAFQDQPEDAGRHLVFTSFSSAFRWRRGEEAWLTGCRACHPSSRKSERPVISLRLRWRANLMLAGFGLFGAGPGVASKWARPSNRCESTTSSTSGRGVRNSDAARSGAPAGASAKRGRRRDAGPSAPAGALRLRRPRRPASGIVTYAAHGITRPRRAETRVACDGSALSSQRLRAQSA